MALDLANKELENVGLIKARPDKKTGKFKSIAYEILPWKGQEVRRMPKEGHIALPSVLVDLGYFRILSLQKIKTLLFLYSHLCLYGDMLLCVHPTVLHARTRKGNGVKSTGHKFGDWRPILVKGEDMVEVQNIEVYDSWDNGQTMNEYKIIYTDVNNILDTVNRVRPLIEWVPIVINVDPEEPCMNTYFNEVPIPGHWNFTDNLDHLNSKYIYHKLFDTQRVIWVLRPKILPKNGDYRQSQGLKRQGEETA